MIQRGRFANDEAFWREHLSTRKVGFLVEARHLSFDLYTRQDFKFFQDTMERDVAGCRWTSVEADGDLGEENGDEER